MQAKSGQCYALETSLKNEGDVPDTANWASVEGELNEKKVIAYVGFRLCSQLQKILPNSDPRSKNTISAIGRDGDSRGLT